jgi:hypothetical protein
MDESVWTSPAIIFHQPQHVFDGGFQARHHRAALKWSAVVSRRDILKIARRLNAGCLTVLQTSPAGTAEKGACRVAALAKTGFVSTVPAGLNVFPTGPGIEMPGYSRWFLRNRTPAQN